MRAMVAAVVALAVASSSGLAVVRRRVESERLERLAEQGRANARTAERLQRARSGTQQRGGENPTREVDDERLFGDFLEALGGGGSGDADLGPSFLEECAAVLGAVEAGGTAGFFGRGEAGGGGGDQQLGQVAAALEELRGLRFRQVPEPVYLSPADLARRVRDQASRELPPGALEAETRVLIALGALPPGSDLRAITLESLGEQVAGFYEPASGELVVARRGRSPRLDGLTRTVLAHELDHALTDQVLDLPLAEGMPPPGTEDAALARLALIEGDATLAMQLYALRHVPLFDQLRGLVGVLASQEDLAALPHHLQRRFAFPYLEGLSFACSLHAIGGWAAVDRAYRTPPTTTAQLLFPQRYRAGEAAVDPRDPSSPEGTWRAAPRQSLGAAELQWLLEAPGGDTGQGLDHIRDRAAAWAGGELQAWEDGDRIALGVALVQRAGERPLCATMAAWYSAAFPSGRRAEPQPDEVLAVDGAAQDAVVRCAGTDVRIGIGPDLATARSVAR